MLTMQKVSERHITLLKNFCGEDAMINSAVIVLVLQLTSQNMERVSVSANGMKMPLLIQRETASTSLHRSKYRS
jgi:hypothetical protein